MRWAREPRTEERNAAGRHGHADTVPIDFAPSSTAADSLRYEVRPPSLFGDDGHPSSRRGLRSWLPTLSGMREWLNSGWQASLQSPADLYGRDALPVAAARLAFIEALGDVDGHAARDLAGRARCARTLRELWHLRNELFTLVSIHHCEHIAHTRLATLNRWFPMRDPGTMRHARPGAGGTRHSPMEGLER